MIRVKNFDPKTRYAGRPGATVFLWLMLKLMK